MAQIGDSPSRCRGARAPPGGASRRALPFHWAVRCTGFQRRGVAGGSHTQPARRAAVLETPSARAGGLLAVARAGVFNSAARGSRSLLWELPRRGVGNSRHPCFRRVVYRIRASNREPRWLKELAKGCCSFRPKIPKGCCSISRHELRSGGVSGDPRDPSSGPGNLAGDEFRYKSRRYFGLRFATTCYAEEG